MAGSPGKILLPQRSNLTIACFIVALTCIGAISPARAQDWSSAPRTETPRTHDHVILGLGFGHAPAYQGADSYRSLPIPAVDVAIGPFFANLRNGLGVNVIDTRTVKLGGSITMMPGYRAKDAPNGIGNLSFGAGGRLFASADLGGVIATVGGTQGFVGNTGGVIVDAGLSYPVVMSSRAVLIPTIGATWSDARHNDRYFGIDAAQSARSGLPQFHPGKGLKDASALLTASYRLTDRLNLAASGGITTLLGEIRRSPLVKHRTQPAGFLSLSFRLGS